MSLIYPSRAPASQIAYTPLSFGQADPSGDLSDQFFRDWIDMANRLGVNPIDLARVGFSETGLNPHINGGLIGFIPSTLQRLGWTGTPQEFWALSAEEQVPYVERYYAPYAGLMTNDGLAYVANFTPAYLAAASASGSDGFVLAREGDGIYNANRILDRNDDGVIDVGDLRAHLDIQDRGSRYEAIIRRLQEAGASAPSRPLTLRSALPWLMLLSSIGMLGYSYWRWQRHGLRIPKWLK